MGARFKQYHPHEFRGIPGGFADWYGIAFGIAFHSYGYGIWTKIAPNKTIVEHIFEGEPSAEKEWNLYDDKTNLPLNTRPHYTGLHGFHERKEFQFGFAWEKKFTNLHGFWGCWAQYCDDSANGGGGGGGGGGSSCYRFKDADGNYKENCDSSLARFAEAKTQNYHFCYCWWNFSSYFSYRDSWSAWGYANHFEPLKLKFHVSAASWRFRMEGSGQNMCEYEWYLMGEATIWSVPHRFVHVRSPVKAGTETVCLSDMAPRWSNERNVSVMECKMAAKIYDAREVWYMNIWPGLKRWYGGGGALAFRNDGIGMPVIRLDVKDGAKEAIIQNRDEANMEFTAADREKQCLVPDKDKKFEYWCGKEILNTEMSSRIVALDNNACSPGKQENGAMFFWLPDDPLPTATFKTYHPYANLDRIELKMWKKVQLVSIWCFNDHVNKWYAVEYAENVEEMNLFMHTEYCTYLQVRVEKYNNPCEVNKDVSGAKKCQGIASIKFFVEYYKTKFDACEYPSPIGQQWFFEPSNYHPILGYYNETYQEFSLKKTELIETMLKFSTKSDEVTYLSANEEQSFGTDPVADNYVDLQPCTKGCAAYGDGKTIDIHLREILTQRARFKMPPGGGGKYKGESKSMTAPSCSFIKSAYNATLSGFYWIKNDASEQATKVYCIMSNNPPVGVSLENAMAMDTDNMITQHDLKASNEFLVGCSKFGLKFASISNLMDLKRLTLLAVLKGIWIHDKYGILIGVDNGCPSNCTGKFFSLDGATNMNDLATKFNADLGKNFEAIKGNMLLVLQNGGLTTVMMNSDTTVAAILCQTINEEMLAKATCNDTIKDMHETKMASKFICMEDCNNTMPVYGNMKYNPDSNLCKAMKHSGNFIEYGGLFVSKVMKEKKLCKGFQGGSGNGVDAEPMEGQGECYGFSKILDKNPADNLAEIHAAKSSFLQRLSFIQKFQLLAKPKSKPQEENTRSMINPLNMADIDIDPYDQSTIRTKKMAGTKMATNLYGNHNVRVRDQYQQDQSVINNQYIAHKSVEMMDEPLTDAKNEMNPAQYHLPNMHDSYNGLKTFRQSNVNRTFRGKGIRKYNNKYKHYRQGDHELLAYDNGFKMIKYYKQPNVLFFENYKPVSRNENEKNFIDKTENHWDLWINSHIKKLHDFDYQEKNPTEFNNYMELFNKYSTLKPEILKKFISQVKNDVILDHPYAGVSFFKQRLGSNFVDKAHNKMKKRRFKQKSRADKNKKDGDDKKEGEGEDEEEEEEAELSSEEKKIKELYGDFHDQSKLPAPPGIYWKAGEMNVPKDADYVYVDFRSDEQRLGDEYYRELGKDIKRYPHYEFFTKKGDDTKLSTQDVSVIAEEPIKAGKATKEKWDEDMPSMDKNFKKYQKLVTDHLATAKEVMIAYGEVIGVAESAMGLANYMINYVKTTMALIDDQIMKLFAYSSIGYSVDLRNDVEDILPGYWRVLNPPSTKETASDNSVFKLITPTAIELQSDPVNEEIDYAVMLVSKFHRTYDGAFHFNLNAKSAGGAIPLVGAFFRFSDAFNHYKVSLDFEKKMVRVARVTTFGFLMLLNERLPAINLNTKLRVVITFKKEKFKIWVHEDEGGFKAELDEDKRKEDYAFQNDKLHMLPFMAFDTGIKEGAVGFFCNKCKGVLFDVIQLWADVCEVNSKRGGYENLLSACSARYKEDFKKKVESKMSVNYDDSLKRKKAKFKFQSAEGKLRSIINSEPATIPGLSVPAFFAFYKNPFILQYTMWTYIVSAKVNELDTVGSFSFIFLASTPKTYFVVTIKVNTDKHVKEAIISEVTPTGPQEIQRNDMPDSYAHDKWNTFMLTLVGSDFFLILNGNTLVFDTVKVDAAADKSGTIGVGINGTITEFSDMKMDCVGENKFLAYVESLRKKDQIVAKMAIGDITAEGLGGPDAELPGSGELTAEDGVAEASYEVCIATDSTADRKKWIEDEIGTTKNPLEINFCNSCCDLNASKAEKGTCKEECNKALAPEEPTDDAFNHCYNSEDPTYQKDEKFTGCIKCVESIQIEMPSIPEGMIAIKKNECENMRKCDDPMKCTTSLALENEEE